VLHQLCGLRGKLCVSGGAQEQGKGVGQKAVTAQAVNAKAVFKLLDAILALSVIVVESEDLGGRSVASGTAFTSSGAAKRLT
jgi:hypothetical protein